MNAGFSNLATLKAYLLAKAIRSSTDYDAAITSIGLGIAGFFERYCGRKFAYTPGFQEVFGADRAAFCLSLFPVVPPVTLVEFKQDESTGWVAQDQTAPSGDTLVIQSLDAENGVIYFPDNEDCGEYWSQMRFTYTGGYWWQQLEPTDEGYPAAQPAGSANLPNSLLEAWLIQCEIAWKMRDKLGKGLSAEETKGRGPLYEINDLDLAPQVKQMLEHHVRPQWT